MDISTKMRCYGSWGTQPHHERGAPQPNYVWEIHYGVFVVVDLDIGRTVTNAASDVVSELAARHGPLAAPLVYRDTLGRWDGMTVRSGRFAGYYPLAESYEEARKILHRMIEDHDPRLGDALPPLDMLSNSRCSAAGRFVGSAEEPLLAIDAGAP